MKIAVTIVGVLLVLVGSVWFLQGVGVLLGSFMSGQSTWATRGAIAVVLGIVLLWASRRGKANSRANKQ